MKPECVKAITIIGPRGSLTQTLAHSAFVDMFHIIHTSTQSMSDRLPCAIYFIQIDKSLFEVIGILLQWPITSFTLAFRLLFSFTFHARLCVSC